MLNKHRRPKEVHPIAPQCILIVLMAFTLFAKEKKEIFGSITGKVIDRKTELAVHNATVSLFESTTRAETDSVGFFIFEQIPVGLVDFTVSADGYDNRLIHSITIKSGVNKPILVELSANQVDALEKMIIASSRVMEKRAEQSTSVIKLSRDEVINSPGSIFDVNRVLQTFASTVGTSDDMFNEFYVRGGNGNENIFLIDDIEVNNLSHWGPEYGSGGAISTLHQDFIRDIDFYAGGFPAQYPPRLSSISDIHFREGSKTDWKAQVDMNMAGIGGMLEGPIIKERMSIMANARLSALDIMETFLDLEGVPQYKNAQAKIVFDINQNHKLIGNILGGTENITLKGDDPDEGNWGWDEKGSRAIGGIQWRAHSDNAKNKLLFSGIYHRYDGEGTQDDSIVTENMLFLRERFQLKDNLNLFLREQDILHLGASLDFEKFFDRYTSQDYFVYADLHHDSTYYYYKGEPDSTLDRKNLRHFKAQHDDTSMINFRISGYAGYSLFLGKLKINLGLRNDYFTLPEKMGLSPRLALTYDLGNAGIFSVSSGLYHQYPSYVNQLHFTDNITSYDLQRNVQVVGGWEKRLNDFIVAGAEVYHKYYDREPLYTFDEGERVISETPDTYGIKKAYGFELYLHKKRVDHFYYQLSYTFYDARQQYADGKWYTADNTIRNCANIIAGSNVNKNHAILLRFDLTEGFPYTPVDLASSNASLRTIYRTDEGWNNKRRDVRAKLSIRYNLKLYFKKMNITAYVEAQNILNQRDVIYEWYSRGAKFGKGSIGQSLSRGIFPIGGMTIDF